MGQEHNLDNVSGIILAGGSSSRLGRNKALFPIGEQPLIARVIERLQAVVGEIMLVTNDPRQFEFLGLPMTGDVFRGVGVLGGLHAGLSAVQSEYGLVVGCDMPFLSVALLRFLASLRTGYDVVLPRIDHYFEPLHAVYSRRCVPAIENSLRSGRRRILQACSGLRIRYVDRPQLIPHDPELLSFFNLNTTADLERMHSLFARTDRPGKGLES